MKIHDVIIVGGGHAGCEAALAAARVGVPTLLITMDKSKTGYTSCNPSIGGVGKGQLVKEVDALGGEMGHAADSACIQYRLLNSSKGYAARSSRMQIDRKLYNNYILQKILEEENLDIVEDEVKELVIEGDELKGVLTKKGKIFKSETVVITTGTFMNGIIHVGLKHKSGGRIGEDASLGLSDNLRQLGFNVSSLKTGTPARINKDSLNYSVMEAQGGDVETIPFSFETDKITLPQVLCYTVRTNKKTHEIIKKGLDQSPLYTGKIKSTGVRYCPSIEDKIMRFTDKNSHVIFVEPEGLDSNIIYPNGISTSLPVEIQEEMLHSVRGFEKAKIEVPAYGIEYDYVDPTELMPTLETKKIKNLFIAGQINGTTGYEEAAALGLMAGVNAALKTKKKEPFILDRSQAYIGVLIDDLVTKGTKEPYRMFTSRVEYRLTIREDNADERLTLLGHELGLISDERLAKIEIKKSKIENARKKLSSTKANLTKVNELIEKKGKEPLIHNMSLLQLFKRTDFDYKDILSLLEEDEKNEIACLNYYERVGLEVDIRYAGYISREMNRIAKFKDLEKIKIPENMDYTKIKGISNEICEKLAKFKPVSLGQASRISGVTPASISVLMVRIKTKREK